MSYEEYRAGYLAGYTMGYGDGIMGSQPDSRPLTERIPAPVPKGMIVEDGGQLAFDFGLNEEDA